MVVMHDLTLAAAYCDRLALLHRGRLVAIGTPLEVLTEATLREVYGPLVSVIPHPRTGLPVIAPDTVGQDAAQGVETAPEADDG